MKMFKILVFFSYLIAGYHYVAQQFLPLNKIDKSGIKLSLDPGVFSKHQVLNLKSKNGRSFSVEVNGSKVRSSGGNATISINKNSIVKVYIPKTDKVYVGSYFIRSSNDLPVISLHLNYDQFVGKGGIIDGYITENQKMVGKVWQKTSLPVFFEYLNAENNFGTYCRVMPHGGFTLGLKEKSLRIYRDSLLGSDFLKINPFENRYLDAFKSVVLRTSGSDQGATRIKDITLASIARDMGIDYQDYRQSALYVNGEYFGIYNIREKLNKEYLKYNFGADKDSTILLELEGTSNKKYREFLTYIKKKFPDESAFDSLNSKMNVEEYLNWIILQTHIQNIDSRGNIRYWKAENLDNRWRWIFYDSDLGCDLGSTNLNYLSQRLSPTKTTWYNPTWSTQILRDIVKHKPLKHFFINQYCLMLGTHMHIDSIQNRISYFASKIAREIPQHVMRRGQLYGETQASWQARVKAFRKFFTIRNENAYQHILKSFGLKLVPQYLTIRTDGGRGKMVNAIRLKYGSDEFRFLKAKFFPEIPVKLIASNSDYLYEFDHWDYQNSKEKEITVIAGETKQVTAFYNHRPYSKWYKRVFISQVSQKHNRKSKWYGFGIYNSGDEINNQVFYLWVQGEDSPIKIMVNKLKTDSYCYYSSDPEAFKKKFKKDKVIGTKMVPNFTVRSLQWVLTDNFMKIVDSAFVEFPDSLVRQKSVVTAFRNINGKKWEFGDKFKFDNNSGDKNDFNKIWWVMILTILGLIGGLVLWVKRNKKSKNTIILLLLLHLSVIGITHGQTKDRFGLDSIHTKLIDNKGKGYDSLNGLRNMRVVLKNLVYRGGNNNSISVQNPLMESTLNDLKKVGFNEVIYLYNKNFTKYFSPQKLDSFQNAGLNYVCKPKLDSANIYYILQQIQNRANHNSDSMVYLHCWNGWHQSGWISSIILMQYCDYSNREALQYWASNTDKNYIGYEHVKTAIMNHKVNPIYQFTEEQKKEYCPCKNQEKLDKIFIVEDILGNKTPAQYKPVKTNQNNAPEKLMENYPKPEKKPATRKHVVKSGETLTSISRKTGTTVQHLMKHNKLKSTSIRPGQILYY